MINEERVRAGTIIQCDISRFTQAVRNGHQLIWAVVLTPSARQKNRIVEVAPLTPALPKGRDVLYVEVTHVGLKKLCNGGQLYALCDRVTRLPLSGDDVSFLHRERRSEVNYDPRFYLASDDLKAIRFAIIHQIFPDSDIRTYFKSGLKSFKRLSKKLMFYRTTRKNPKGSNLSDLPPL